MRLVKIDNLVTKCLEIFPSEYWADLYKLRKDKNEPLKSTIFQDLFQIFHTPMGDGTTKISYFSTVPPSKAAWEAVLTAYVVLFWELNGIKVTHSEMAAWILEGYNTQEPDCLPDEIVEFLEEVEKGEKGGLIFKKPSAVLMGILRYLARVSGEKQFVKANPNIDNHLNSPSFKEGFDEEIDFLYPSDQ